MNRPDRFHGYSPVPDCHTLPTLRASRQYQGEDGPFAWKAVRSSVPSRFKTERCATVDPNSTQGSFASSRSPILLLSFARPARQTAAESSLSPRREVWKQEEVKHLPMHEKYLK
jgi:hypothetical protein